MKLKSIAYSQFEGEKSEWKVSELVLGPITLLVGKNASGKTRLLNIIGNLGNLLAGDLKPAFRSGNYDVVFEHGRMGCCRFQRHRVQCIDETGGGSWSDESLRKSSSWRPCG